MKPIACKLGPVSVSVGGDTYTFSRDEHDRFVAEVENVAHRACLLSVEHYHEVDRDPPVPTISLQKPDASASDAKPAQKPVSKPKA